jgi:hypothetical protein
MALFPNTLRSALSAGVVTSTNNFPAGTNTNGTTRVAVNPHLVIEGGTWSAANLTKYNGGFVWANRGGGVRMENVHMDSGRTLLSWSDYIDCAAHMIDVAGWGHATMDATYDSSLVYGLGSGDGLMFHGLKTDNYVFSTSLESCNGAVISSTVGGAHRFINCHGIIVIANHTEQATNIAVTPRIIYDIVDSDVTIEGVFDYMTDSLSTTGAIYLNDSGSEGKHSHVELRNYAARDWITTSDPSGGWAIYINKMNNRSRIRVLSSYQTMSTSGTFATTHGQTGLKISGDGTNEPTLAAEVARSRDLIGSGDFDIVKANTSTMATGQNNPMNISIRGIGQLNAVYQGNLHVTPTFYDAENMGSGTLTNGQAYAYCAAVCNTLPDGTIQYGAATAEWLQTAPAGGAMGFEMYTPSGAGGATLVIWRKTGTGVLAGATRYVLIPIGSAATRLWDSGANISKIPWITTAVPVPNTVAGTNHTADALYFNTTQITIP